MDTEKKDVKAVAPVATPAPAEDMDFGISDELPF